MTTGRWEEATISTHLRVAASVCVLSTGLLIGSPAAAIAAADTGSGSNPGTSSTATSTSAAATSAASTTTTSGAAGAPSGSVVDSLRTAVQNTLHGVTVTLSALAKAGQQQSSGVNPPKMIFGGTPTVHGSTGTGSSAAQTASDVAAPTPTEPSVVSPPAAEPAQVPIPSTTPAAWVPTPVRAVSNVVVPVSNVIAAVATSVASTPALLVSLPTSATPVSDVLASLQDLITSVSNASTPLTQLPSDLSALLGVGTVLPGTTTAGTGAERIGPSAAIDAPMPMTGTGLLQLPAAPGSEGVPVADELAGPATPRDVTTSGISSGVKSSASVLAPRGDDSSVLSIVQQVIGAFVATVSLTALAAVALPGIVGLLGTSAAGIRIGYRQAKTGSALQTTAISRFVGSGPIGVVRSGSQISLRPRVVRSGAKSAAPTRAAGPIASTSARLLDRAG